MNCVWPALVNVQVVQQQDGTSQATYAFSTVPRGSNVSTYVSNNVEFELQGSKIYPFNETYQAALMNQLHVAFDTAGIPHTIYYNSTTVSFEPLSLQIFDIDNLKQNKCAPHTYVGRVTILESMQGWSPNE